MVSILYSLYTLYGADGEVKYIKPERKLEIEKNNIEVR